MKEREALLDRMIRIYGFENPITIEFAQMIEKPQFKTQFLTEIVKIHKTHPQYCED